jgi:hypothetical protein
LGRNGCPGRQGRSNSRSGLSEYCGIFGEVVE